MAMALAAADAATAAPQVYIPLGAANKVQVIDVATKRPTLVAIDLASGQAWRIALAPAPYHVSSVPGSGTVLVSSRAEKRIWVIDQSTLALRGEITIDGIGHQMAVMAR